MKHLLIATLVLVLLLATGARAAVAQERSVVVIQVPQPGLVETALAACAGGAVIGALVVYVGAAGSAGVTAGLFCGLSAAASIASTATVWTWHTAISPFR